MAAILIFCQICHKTMFFAFYFVICFLLTIYFSKYLQFPLNIITHLENYVTEHVFVEDNGPWKGTFFIFAIFSFPIFGGF